MDRQHGDEEKEPQHHPLGHLLQAPLEAEAAHQKAGGHRQNHPKGHLAGAGQHGGKDPVHRLPGKAGEGPGGKLYKVPQHPAGNGGVVHHQQGAARHAEPAVDVPAAPRLFQGLVGQDGAFAAGPAHRQLHGEHRHPHQQEEQQVKEHKDAAAVGPGDIGELPDVPNAHGAPHANQQEAQAGTKTFSLHPLIHLLQAI